MGNTILLVGCGNMGFAMLKGWLAADPGLDVHVVEPVDALRDRAASVGASVVDAPGGLPNGLAPDLVFLAVKPQMMADVVPDYARLRSMGASFVSVAAGTTIAALEGLLGGAAPVIRCMPNTPAAIGLGMMVCCANAGAPQAARDLAGHLLAASGSVAWIEDEDLMDAVTALSGSGPAYVFHLIECMAKAGEDLGLPTELAGQMALQTVMGAGALAAGAEDPPGTLREQVTSPGGTTAAALGVLMADDGMQPVLTRAMTAARDRGRELGRA